MTLISSLIIGVCLVIASLIISNTVQNNQIESKKSQNKEFLTEKQLLTGPELAKYLGISEQELSQLLASINPKNSDGSREIGLSYIEINNKMYFAKKAVDEWLLTGQGKYVQIVQ